MYKAIFYTHLVSVNLFILIYLVKTILLLANKNEILTKFTKSVKVPEMIISTLFLLTGIYMLTQIPEIKSMMVIKIVAVFVSIPLAVIGFKKGNKALAVIAFLLIVGAYGMAEMSKKQKSPAVEAVVVSTDGHELYIANCARCHGDDGKLGLMDSKDLTLSVMDLQQKMEIIKNGKGVMTPFAGQLSDEQIKTVAEYTETLKNN
ncbi:MAG: c-type cytochrome [Bacteroidota bacterium]